MKKRQRMPNQTPPELENRIHVEPIEVINHEGGKTEVRVHHIVKNPSSDILSDTTGTGQVRAY